MHCSNCNCEYVSHPSQFVNHQSPPGESKQNFKVLRGVKKYEYKSKTSWKEELSDGGSTDDENDCVKNETDASSSAKFKCSRKRIKKLIRGKRKGLKGNPCSFTPATRNRATKERGGSARKYHINRDGKFRGHQKKFSVSQTLNSDKKWEICRKGKRGRVGGKAKGKPPDKDESDPSESDEEYENGYFYRISLGHFQQSCKDDVGASTSNQINEDFEEKNLEEKELSQLQNWGRSSLVYAFRIDDDSNNDDAQE